MKAIVVGLGSMGRRRARLLHDIDKSIQIIGVDMQSARRKQAEDELGIQTSESIELACREYQPEVAFISTSPLSHAEIIKECLERNLHVFTELNLVTKGYDENIKLARTQKRELFLSSTFLYRKEIQYIKKAVHSHKGTLSYMYHAGQYLPDWHPWESYKDFFIGKKETNGCREFMAIEFPWLIDTFGNIQSAKAIKGKYSSLDIDFADTYHIMLEHDNGNKGMLTVDVVSRKAVRNLEVSGENLYLTWNGTPDTLNVYDYTNKQTDNISLYESVENREGYSSFIIEDAYKSEIDNFLNVVAGKEKARYSFEQDKKVLSIIDMIAESEENL